MRHSLASNKLIMHHSVGPVAGHLIESDKRSLFVLKVDVWKYLFLHYNVIQRLSSCGSKIHHDSCSILRPFWKTLTSATKWGAAPHLVIKYSSCGRRGGAWSGVRATCYVVRTRSCIRMKLCSRSLEINLGRLSVKYFSTYSSMYWRFSAILSNLWTK